MPVLAEQGMASVGVDADHVLDLGLGVVGIGVGQSILLSTGTTSTPRSSAV
jgi:hypothetical protein